MSVTIPITTELIKRGILIAAILGLSVLSGFALSMNPTYLLLVLGPLLGIGILSNGSVQLIVVVEGALLVLGSEETALTTSKLAYFLVFLGCLAIALFDIWLTKEDHDSLNEFALLMSIAAAFYLAFSAFRSVTGSVTPTTWLRDALPLIIIATSPIFAMHLRDKISSRALESILILVGVTSAIGTVARWATARGVLDLQLPTSLFPNQWPAMVLIAYGMAKYLVDDRRKWLVLCSVLIGFLLLTATRGMIVLTLGLILGAIIGVHLMGARRVTGRSIQGIAIATLLAIGVISAASYFGYIKTDVLLARFSTVLDPSSISSGDLSYEGRAAQSETAWTMFRNSPIVGVGLGTTFTSYYWSATYNQPVVSTSMDSPLAFPAEQGIVGVVALAIFFRYLGSLIRKLLQKEPSPILYPFIGGIVGCIIVSIPLLDIAADRGFGLAVLLTVVIAANSAISASRIDTAAENVLSERTMQ